MASPHSITLSAKDVQRFWSKVQKGPGCWLWTASCKPFGYGQFHVMDNAGKRHTLNAHRVSWELAKGRPPLKVLHRCDQPRCVKVEHLFLGTDADNATDKATKGRAAKKLEPWEVIEIRKGLEAGVPQRALAHGFSLSQATIHNIKHRKAWGWL